MSRSSRREVFCTKVTLKSFAKFTRKLLYLRKLQDACDSITKETPVQVFSCGFSEIFRGIFLAGHLEMATSECSLFYDFSEKKTFNCKLKGNTFTSLNSSFI